MIIVVDQYGTIHATAKTHKQLQWFDGYGLASDGVSILGSKDDFTIVETDQSASIGMLYVDGKVVAPQYPAPELPPPAPPTFPRLTRRQLRLGLLSIGVTAEAVEAEIARIADEKQRAASLIEWQDASSYKRDHPVLAKIAQALKLPADQVDTLWLWAATL